MASLLDRVRIQTAEKVLAFQQDAIRSHIRMEGELKQQQARIAPKLSPQKIESADAWIHLPAPKYKGMPIVSCPKTREFWSAADFTKMSTRQLQAIADLLGIDLDGKKVALVARLQDWVNEPAILAHKRRVEREAKKREKFEASGGVFGFGNNFAGQLGLGHRDPCEKPTEIIGLKGKKIVKVFTGFDADYAFALSSTGEVYSWGGNGVGPTAFPPKQAKPESTCSQPPLPKETSFLLPSVVRNLRVEDVESFSCARVLGHVAAVTKSGQCYTWGKNDYGVLGYGHVDIKDEHALPKAVSGLDQAMIVAVSVGNSHTIAVTNAGKCFSWGAAWGGQLGLGVTKREGVDDRKLQMCYPAPTLVELTVRVTQVSCGAAHSALISTNGQLFMFGCGDGGRLGLGSNADVLSPTTVHALEKERVQQVFCSNWHTLCIAAPRQVSGHASALDNASGWVYSFGNGLNGQLGLGKQRQALLPTKIPELMKRKMKCIDVKASSYHSCALSEDGTVFTWGRNTSGCLGRFSAEWDSYEPDVISEVKTWGYGPVTSIACGCRFTLLVAAPWKGISKPPYNISNELNNRLKMKDYEPEICLVPSGLLNFEGRIMPNAYTFADMDGDGDRELIVGAMSGELAIFKGLASSESVCEHTVNGCITSIVTHRILIEIPDEIPDEIPERKNVILVMTAEGTCFVFRRELSSSRESGIELSLHCQFTIPFNVSAATILDTHLVLGTRDAAIHIYDVTEIENAKSINILRLPGEVESFLRIDDNTLHVCLHTGEVVEATLTSAYVIEHGESLQCGRSYILNGIKSKGVRSCDAYGYFNGQVKLKDKIHGDELWSIQLPDALLTMATINLFEDGDEEVILCCWSGDVYIVNRLGSQLKFRIPFSITAFFSGSFSPTSRSDDVLFSATTSGGILYYTGIGQSIRHIRHDSVMEVITHSPLYDSINSPEKRRHVLDSLQRYLPSIQVIDSDNPSLQECIRACVYASNSILKPEEEIAPCSQEIETTNCIETQSIPSVVDRTVADDQEQVVELPTTSETQDTQEETEMLQVAPSSALSSPEKNASEKVEWVLVQDSPSQSGAENETTMLPTPSAASVATPPTTKRKKNRRRKNSS